MSAQTNPPIGPQLSDEQVDAILAWADYHGRKRHHEQGKQFVQADFIAGVGAALFAGGRADRFPAEWLFGTMRGDDLFPTTEPAARPHAALVSNRVYRVNASHAAVKKLIYCEGDFYTRDEWKRANRGVDRPSFHLVNGNEVRAYAGDSYFCTTADLEDTGETVEI